MTKTDGAALRKYMRENCVTFSVHKPTVVESHICEKQFACDIAMKAIRRGYLVVWKGTAYEISDRVRTRYPKYGTDDQERIPFKGLFPWEELDA